MQGEEGILEFIFSSKEIRACNLRGVQIAKSMMLLVEVYKNSVLYMSRLCDTGRFMAVFEE